MADHAGSSPKLFRTLIVLIALLVFGGIALRQAAPKPEAVAAAATAEKASDSKPKKKTKKSKKAKPAETKDETPEAATEDGGKAKESAKHDE